MPADSRATVVVDKAGLLGGLRIAVGEDGRERLARAVDAILGLARDRPVLMRQHMAGLLQAEGFVECPEQRRLSELLGDTVARYGSADVTAD